MLRLSVIIPTLNEEQSIPDTLGPLQAVRRAGHDVVIADGGSTDATLDVARSLVDRVVVSAPGRARQMNAGAAVASGELLWFLHADTALDIAVVAQLQRVARRPVWGRFDVRLSGRLPMLRVVERSMNLRSRVTGIATGDQGIFVSRELFESVGGYPEIPLMEDIALSRLLRAQKWPTCLPGPLITSSRRWERDGVWRTILLMWRLRLGYFLGADPARLHRRYYGS